MYFLLAIILSTVVKCKYYKLNKFFV